jgi:N-acyl-D-amino-acid deacylase
LIDEARARGVDVVAAQHVYTSTHSGLRAYCIPRWATVGGEEEMKKRFTEPESRARLMKEIPEMLEIRGGAEKLVFSDPRPHLNGKTLADVAQVWGIDATNAVFRILSESNAGVMNRDLYDGWNTEFLARQGWMMTCTDGGTPEFGKGIVHPRSYGAFTRKLKEYVYNKDLISLPFAIRGMTSQAANFYRISNRGMIKEGYYADIAVFDEARIQDKATYTEPHQYSEGTLHVLVNGKFAFRDGRPTETLAGQPLPRGAR